MFGNRHCTWNCTCCRGRRDFEVSKEEKEDIKKIERTYQDNHYGHRILAAYY
jgi:hypothetical protein